MEALSLITEPQYFDPKKVADERSAAQSLPSAMKLLLYDSMAYKHIKFPPFFTFPVTMDQDTPRRFRRTNIKGHNSFTYSKCHDAIYCKVCLLFAPITTTLNSFVGNGYRKWKNVGRDISKHEDTTAHKDACARLISTRNPQSSITHQLSAISQPQQQINRGQFMDVANLILWLAVQGLSLRGHRDENTKTIAATEEPKSNPGNFHSLIRLFIHTFKYDRLRELIIRPDTDRTRPITYTSNISQNGILRAAAGIIRTRITDAIKRAECFSILADEATDQSNSSQMVVCYRFVVVTKTALGSLQYQIIEAFYTFRSLAGLRGDQIKSALLQAVTDSGLDMSKCCGLGFDGGSNMAGKLTGAAALIQQQHPSARYFHCVSHQLALCLASACQKTVNDCIAKTLQVIGDTSKFFQDSPKRAQVLKFTFV